MVKKNLIFVLTVVKISASDIFDPAQCRPILNQDVVGFRQNPQLEFECMKQGIKHVWLGYEDTLQKLPEQWQEYIRDNTEQIRLPPLFEDYFGKTIVIVYTQKGKFNALLLALLQFQHQYTKLFGYVKNYFFETQQKQYKTICPYYNAYLHGHLLDYEDKDIKFHYQLHTF